MSGPGFTSDPDIRALRAEAVQRSLCPAAGVPAAVAALRFLQLDPIRAPARAADLVLRQRVADYRAGDLDRLYPGHDLAEDCLHVYGVMPRTVRDLLHPRPASHRYRVEREYPRLPARVLAHVAEHGDTHPRDLDGIGGHRTTNAWGGESSVTTRILEALHFRGKLRVSRRVNGVRVYALAHPPGETLPAAARARALLHLLVALYAPLHESTLRQLLRMITESSISSARKARAFEALRRDPAIERFPSAGATWLRPADSAPDHGIEARVRLLAPFDPVVWDRRRFALLWGFDYRLEAYTPPARRRFGYYALPVLWRDEVVGWANAAVANDVLDVGVRFAQRAPRERSFRRELEAEAERLRECIGAPRVQVRLDAA